MLKGRNAVLPDILASSLRRMYRLIGRGVLTLLLSVCSFAQSSDSLNWFPYKSGDMWEYWFYDGITLDTTQIINIKDSASADGKIHLTQIRQFINPIEHNPYLDSLKYTIDTTAGEVFGRPAAFEELHNVLVYRFDVQPGDIWVMYDNNAPPGGFRYEMARVVEVYESVLFGTNRTFMAMHYYLAQDSTDTLGLTRYGATLAEGFGLVDIFISEGGWTYDLKGASINGVLYGDTTQVLATVEDLSGRFIPQTVKLHQNYPNPFNASTTISFDLDASRKVSLTVYDLRGVEIKRLIDTRWLSAGTHVVMWNGRTNGGTDAPSGIYTYRLTTGRYGVARSMIIIK